MRVLTGERIGRLGRIRLGCSAAIFDETGTKLLLTRRSDNGEWCLPGGGMEPGENAEEACVREVWEETALQIEVTGLVGVYSNPNLLVEYPDGNRVQIVSLCFAAKVIDGTPSLSDETTAFGFYTLAEMQQIQVVATNVQRVQDAFDRDRQPFIR